MSRVLRCRPHPYITPTSWITRTLSHQYHTCVITQPTRAYHQIKGGTFDPNPHSNGARVGELVLTTKVGVDVLLDPLFNKGTGFPMEERERLGLRGLVPPRVPLNRTSALETGRVRVMTRYHKITDPVEKYQYLIQLQDRNETLFYRCLVDYIEELAPIVYTPTVGIACQGFSYHFRRPRGMYFSAADIGNMASMTYNWPMDEVHIIVVTDGSRILGLGDLGCNGMGIPIGKLSLYSAAAGIHPAHTLPVLLDVGTNNESLLSDPMYIGLRQHRLTGDQYLAVVDEFINAVRERWPKVLIQFEDFSNENAARLLEKYRKRVLCFNDDIQGTGCVSVAAALSALRAIGQMESTALTNQRIVIMGAGSAGLGVGSALKYAMKQQGLSETEAQQRFWVLDDKGSLGAGRTGYTDVQKEWIRHDIDNHLSLEQVIAQVKPTILFGLTGVGGLFTERSIREMAKHVQRPILFPLSNPTSRAECTAEQAWQWTDGRAVFASGSPFDVVEYKGEKRYPGQSNNMYTFPGIGLGALTCHAKYITDRMLYVAAVTLAEQVSPEDCKLGKIFPPVRDIRRVTENIAVAIMLQAFRENVATIPLPEGDVESALRQMVTDAMWSPAYGQTVRVNSI